MKLTDKRIKQGEKEEASWLRLPEFEEGEFIYFDYLGLCKDENDDDYTLTIGEIRRNDWEFVSKEREAVHFTEINF